MIKFSSNLFFQKLSHHLTVSKYPGFENSTIDMFLIYDNTRLKENYLYLIELEDLQSAITQGVKCTFLCKGKPIVNSDFDSNIMYISSNTSITKLYNLTSLIFYEFNQFINSVIDIDNHLDLDRIIEITHNYLNLDIFVSNESFELLTSSTSNQYIFNGENVVLYDEYPLFAVQNIMTYPELKDFELHDSIYYISKTHSNHHYNSMLYNFKERKSYIGALLATKIDSPLNEAEKDLFQFVAKTIEHKYKISHISESKSYLLELKSLLNDIIEKEIFVSTNLKVSLTNFGWNLEDSYRISIINFCNTDSFTAKKYYEDKIEKLCTNCIVLCNDIGLICIERISETCQSFDNLLHIFSNLFSETKYLIGVSNSGSLSRFVELQKQSRFSIEMGKKLNSDLNVFFFENYAFFYLLHNCTRNVYKEDVCHSSLKTLKEYDSRNGSNLYNTLKSYFKFKLNIQHCANSLFIHRTTLLYRLKTIKKLTAIDIDDFRTRTHIEFSFFLMDDDK